MNKDELVKKCQAEAERLSKKFGLPVKVSGDRQFRHPRVKVAENVFLVGQMDNGNAHAYAFRLQFADLDFNTRLDEDEVVKLIANKDAVKLMKSLVTAGKKFHNICEDIMTKEVNVITDWIG